MVFAATELKTRIASAAAFGPGATGARRTAATPPSPSAIGRPIAATGNAATPMPATPVAKVVFVRAIAAVAATLPRCAVLAVVLGAALIDAMALATPAPARVGSVTPMAATAAAAAAAFAITAASARHRGARA